MAIGARDFPNQMGRRFRRRRTSLAETKFGVDWLQAMWDDVSKTFYYQIGIGNGNSQTVSDHDIWRLPQADDTYNGCSVAVPLHLSSSGVRQSRRCGCTRCSQDQSQPGGPLAAVLACATTFIRRAILPTQTSACSSAEHIFDLANTAPSGNLLTAIPFSFYPETEWRDDMELGAAELYFAVQGCGQLPH